MTKIERKDKTLNAKLFVRILPSLEFSHDAIKIEKNKQVIHVRCMQDLSKGVQMKNPNYWSFCTDGILWNASQAEVFETVASDWYDDIFEGVSGMILSYGQTGSGKTFTTSGLRFNFTNRGLALRILSQLFDGEEQRRDVAKIYLGMSYLEFVGETVRDLISDKTVEKIRDVAEYPLPSVELAWKQIFGAECRKLYAENAPYKGSNRGHSVLTFYIHTESLIDTDPVITHSKVNLVDMGGIGNLGSKASAWQNKWDLGHSNLSKSLMEQLILCLNGGTWQCEGHICPYKSSRFLMYLHETLQPNCLIRFIAHVDGSEANLPIAISTLKFGERLRSLKPTKLERIVESHCALKMKNLEKECLRLREEAELTGMLRDSPDYCNMSRERLYQIKRAAEGYLLGQLENLTLLSMGQACLTLELFKELYHKLSAEKDQMIKDAIAAATEMLQNQLAAEKNSNLASPVVPNTQRVSRRRSRQQDSQLLFGATFRSSDSGQGNIGKVTSAIQGGVSDRRGISIGPGKLSSGFEGNITKAFKKLRRKRSDSLIIKAGKTFSTRDVGIPLSKTQIAEDITEYPIPQDIPSRDLAWQNFCSENPDYSKDLRVHVESCEETTKSARKKYVSALAEVAQLREEVEECKLELENCQHLRQMCRKGEFDDECNPIPGELEKEFTESLIQKEESLNVCIENCHVALIDFKTCIKELNQAKKTLEEAFEEFCRGSYKIVYLPEELCSADVKSEGSVNESPCQIEKYDFKLHELYLRLQKKLINYVLKSKRKKWKNY